MRKNHNLKMKWSLEEETDTGEVGWLHIKVCIRVAGFGGLEKKQVQRGSAIEDIRWLKKG